MMLDRRCGGLVRCASVAAVLGVAGCGSHPAPPRDASVSDIATDTGGGPDIAYPDVVISDAPLTLTDVALPDAAVTTARPLAPLSSSIVRSARPRLRWLLPAGATDVVLEICADRACATVEQSAAAMGNGGAPANDLTAGVHWWRLRSPSSGTSPVWELFVRPATGMLVADVVDGAVADFDGDGLADLAVSATHANGEAGRVYVYKGRHGGVASTADLVLDSAGGMAGHFGWALTGAGDVDGDGYDDLVVTAPDVGGGTGQVFVFRGSATGLSSTPATTLAAPDPSGNFGAAVSSGGDLNGDGYADVIVSAPNAMSSTGRAYVYLGSATGLPTTPTVTLAGNDGPASTFGYAVAIVGDANHDGYDDAVVGASNAEATVGVAHVFYGQPQGLASAPDLTLPSPSGDSGQFGATVAAAGDVNGDGYADVAIAAPQTLGGDAWIYLGGPSGLLPMPSSVVSGPDGPQGGFGWALGSAGDVNHDGYDDVVVTAPCAPYHLDPDGGYPTCGAGRAHLFLGSSSGMQAAPVTPFLAGPSGEPASFGWSVLGAHDLDGDGYDDVAVGAEAATQYAGAVYVFSGAAGGLATMPSATLTGTDGAGANFGWSLALREPLRRRNVRPAS